MAVYKVIQDVEAEDKLLGPLTFKSFIYAIIAGICLFINYKLLLIGTPIKWLFIIVFAVPMILFGVLAAPLGRDQPTELWLLSKIRFFLKPRDRIWDQEGMEELVTVTAPKKEDLHLTKDLTQTEVRSRLKVLASTLDTRGWAVKNVDTNLNLATSGGPGATIESDRLVANAGYSQPAPVVDVHASDDILDEQNNPTAQKFAQRLKQADDDRKRKLLAAMKDLIKKAKPEEAGRPAKSGPKLAKTPARVLKADSKKQTASGPLRPAAKPLAAASSARAKPTAVTSPSQAVNMELAQSGSAFSVATLAQLANRQPQAEQTGPNEITISLH
ncbi:MAG TPA: PrgI family protein [Candidatus Saccharimonadales bacterium]|nr:PrgI family protein [Candidatus Saccharimonadales bacterium]